MTSPITFQPSTAAIHRRTTVKVAGNFSETPSPVKTLRLPPRRFTLTSCRLSENVASTSSEPSTSSEFISSVGSPTLQLTLTQRHFTVLNIFACAVAISATWLFCSAIPTLLAFKKAAESLEKLLDVTREELPDTMAAVRLSGMEISDLTTELSDLGQELTQGVRSSTNAVRVAEERLRQFANMTSRAPMQMVVNAQPNTAEPAIARSARGIREGIVKGRGMLNVIFTLTRFSTSVGSYLWKRAKKRSLNK